MAKDRFSVIREWDIDLLLLEEFCCSVNFVSWFCKQASDVGKLPALETVACTARHSVSYPGEGSGESDLEVTIRGKRGHNDFSALFLIEDKIAAQFTPDQPERYRKRAVEIAKERRHDAALTVLVAPSHYLESVSAECFDVQISYEQLITQLESSDEWSHLEARSRREHRAMALSHAIDKCRRGGQRINDDERTQFFDEYFEVAKHFEPTLEQNPSRKRSVKSKSFFFEVYPRLSQGVAELFMQHDFKKGWVGIEFRGWGKRRDFYMAKLRGIVESEMTVDAPPKTTLIRIQIRGLPQLDFNRQISDQRELIETCSHAAARLLKWYQAYQHEFEDWVRRPA